MLIYTTLHLNIDTIKRIARAARLFDQSKNNLLSMLLKCLAHEKTLKPVAWSRIRYQDRDVNAGWQCIHVSLAPAEYELLLDLRKVCKMSGSRIIALAVDKYLDGLLDGIHKNLDNYRLSCYIFSKFIMDGVICWAQYWGLPSNLNAFPESSLRLRNHAPIRGS